MCDASCLDLLSQDSFAVQGLLWFLINFTGVFATSLKKKKKKNLWKLDEDCVNPLDDFGGIDILTILVFPVHEHEIPFHVFLSTTIHFISVL